MWVLFPRTKNIKRQHPLSFSHAKCKRKEVMPSVHGQDLKMRLLDDVPSRFYASSRWAIGGFNVFLPFENDATKNLLANMNSKNVGNASMLPLPRAPPPPEIMHGHLLLPYLMRNVKIWKMIWHACPCQPSISPPRGSPGHSAAPCIGAIRPWSTVYGPVWCELRCHAHEWLMVSKCDACLEKNSIPHSFVPWPITTGQETKAVHHGGPDNDWSGRFTLP